MARGDADTEVSEADDPLVVVRGKTWDVAMTPSLHKRFGKFPVPTQEALLALLRIFGDVGPDQFPSTQLNVEGRHPRGDGKEVLIRAFKDGCYRVYGGHVNVRGRPTFICVAYDDKKRGAGKADPALLARAAKALRPYFE
jgi:hypothetical protein